MKCPQCGADVMAEAGFCHKCGAPMEQATTGVGDGGGTPNSARLREVVAQRRTVDDLDETVWEGGFSPKAMLGAWVLCGLVTVAGIVLAVLFPLPLVWLAVGVGVLVLWLLQAVRLLYRRMGVHYRLSHHMLIYDRGVLARVSDRIQVIDMDDITVVQGLIERMQGVGTIRIVSTDRSSPEVVLAGIDGVQQVANQLDELRRAERIRRGLHIETS